jgi:arginine-tRNA-protein transferase
LGKEVHAAEYEVLPGREEPEAGAPDVKTSEERTKGENSDDKVEEVKEEEKQEAPKNIKKKPRRDEAVEPAFKFDVSLDEDTLTDEKFQLYKVYQVHVHNESPEDTTPRGFTRFLCDSPLKRQARYAQSTTEPSESAQSEKSLPVVEKAPRFGSYHLLYRLSGRLIGISVLDILPHAVSSVYFIYHPDYEAFSLGKVSALREIQLTVELGLEYYYMGYWIPRCPKMEYKFDYRPAEILDYGGMTWKQVGDREKKWFDEKHWVKNLPVLIMDGREDAEEKMPDFVDKSDMSPEQMEKKHTRDNLSLWDLHFDGILSEEEVNGIDFDQMGMAMENDDEGEEDEDSVVIVPVTVSS